MLLAAHLVAVNASTGCATVAAAVPVSGRDAVELETVVGPLVNLVVVAADLEPARSVATSIRTVHDAFVGAIGGQRVPYADICAAAPSCWAHTHGGVADAMVQYLDMAGPTTVGGVDVVPLDDPGLVTRFALELIFERRDSGVRIRLTSAPDRLDPATVRGHGAAMVEALRAMPDHLDRPIARLLDVVSCSW